MNTLLYRIGTGAYHTAIRLGALLGLKQARQWVDGRKNAPPLPDQLTKDRTAPLLWMHCASLGEWEQGRPVMEAFRREHPEYKALLSFFSPSGYDRCKNEKAVDHVAYLPADSPGNARDWITALRPDLAIFVKYEFWYFHLQSLRQHGVPTYLVAANFRPEQSFFRSGSGWWRKLLRCFSGIVVQQQASADLLTGPGNFPPDQVYVAGDPRLDRTRELATLPFSDPIVEAFTTGEAITIIAGSVWPTDLKVLWEAWRQLPDNIRIILAPHQLHEPELARTQVQWNAKRYTESSPENIAGARVLLLDTIGILSRVYRFGDIAYIGGAFRTGLHNTLEPLAYGLPVVFGPKHHKFPEAAAAIAAGGAFTVADEAKLTRTLVRLLDADQRELAAAAQRNLGEGWAGAAGRTVSFIQQKAALSSGQ